MTTTSKQEVQTYFITITPTNEPTTRYVVTLSPAEAIGWLLVLNHIHRSYRINHYVELKPHVVTLSTIGMEQATDVTESNLIANKLGLTRQDRFLVRMGTNAFFFRDPQILTGIIDALLTTCTDVKRPLSLIAAFDSNRDLNL